jgi:hypothetical protein
LIFSGGDDAGSEIRAHALTRAKTYGVTAYISLADDGGDALLDDLEDLGARTGYFIDLEYDDPDDVEERLKTASMIVVQPGNSLDDLYYALQGAAESGLRQAYERGAVILFEGLAGNMFGRWVVSDEGELLDGFNWIQDAFIEPESSGMEDSRAVQAVLAEFDHAIAINIAEGSALVLGADGNIEIWGDPPRVTISLGRGFRPDQS